MPYPTTLKVILWTFKTCVEICYLPVHIIRLFKKSQKCPSIEDKLLLLSASEVAERIRKKQVILCCGSSGFYILTVGDKRVCCWSLHRENKRSEPPNKRRD
jgi:hypothetical protein